MRELVVLFEPKPTKRGTTSAILNFQACLAANGIDTKLAYFEAGNEEIGDALKLGHDARDNQARLERIGCTIFYAIESHEFVQDFADAKFLTLIHKVFPSSHVLQDSTIYVSRWLRDSMQGVLGKIKGIFLDFQVGAKPDYSIIFGQYPSDVPYLPHVIPKITKGNGLREELGIPKDAVVLSSLSDPSQFDLRWVKREVLRLLEKNENWYFLGSHLGKSPNPRVLSDFYYSRDDLPRLLGATNLTVFGRKMGESFGVGIAESLSAGIPAIAWAGGRDRNHLVTLRDLNMTYANRKQLRDLIILHVKSNPDLSLFERNLGEYRCQEVFERFIRLVESRRTSTKTHDK